MSELDPLVVTEKSRSRVTDRGSSPRVDVFRIYIRPCVAEFLGTILFVFIGCMSTQNENIVAVALAHGFSIALLIMAFGEISGGHFNPAVTLGVVLCRGANPLLGLFYFLSQLLGGLIGSAVVRAIQPSIDGSTVPYGTQTLARGVEPGLGILTESLLTLILVLVVLLAAVDDQSKTSLAPFAIGLAVVVDILAAGKTTGASMNPARSLGPALVYSGSPDIWTYHYVYWVGPLVGASVAALIYRLLFATGTRRMINF